MRIAFVNWSNRVVGGAERYISRTAEFLLQRGHAVGLWHETGGPADREPILPARAAECWDASELGMAESVGRLRAWRPEIVYCHGLLTPEREAAVMLAAPSVFFAHSYLGTCVGERRTTSFPIIQPCERRFGPACLALFYPRRCGGLNPLTALSNYRSARARLQVLARYAEVVTHSGFVEQVYRQQGIRCRRIRFISDRPPQGGAAADQWEANREWRFLMLSRMEESKGGQTLLEALPQVSRQLDRPIRLTMAGDGASRAAWQAQAEQVMGTHANVLVDFPGWLEGAALQTVLQRTDLLLMPSLWPEPFGLTGLEAAHWGAPSVAFRVGGIPDWLTDGVNGTLAAADPASPASLAAAILRCVADKGLYRRLRAGALKKAREMTMEAHYQDLMQTFETAAGRPSYAVSGGVPAC